MIEQAVYKAALSKVNIGNSILYILYNKLSS